MKNKKLSEGIPLRSLLVKYDNDSSSHLDLCPGEQTDVQMRIQMNKEMDEQTNEWMDTGQYQGDNTSAQMKLKAELKFNAPSVDYNISENIFTFRYIM